MPKVCAKFSVMIKVNKGDFCKKQIHDILLYFLKMFLRISADLNFKGILKIWVYYYHMTISWFPVKVKISSLLINSYRPNPRHDTLDLTQSKKSKYCFIIKI